jgi:hypothetical protein
MAKVFPKQSMHVGGPNGGVFLRPNIGWREDDPFVVSHPDLFDPPEYDEAKDQNDQLRAELAAMKAQLAEAVAAKAATQRRATT